MNNPGRGLGEASATWRGQGESYSIRNESDLDSALRLSAFERVRALTQAHGRLSKDHLHKGFEYLGARIPLVNPQRGIFKPRQMTYLLSIRTVFPRPGRRVWYDDQREVLGKIFEGEEFVEYAFMGSDPNAADNQWLLSAMENKVPVIYFLGVAPGLYEAILPTYVTSWNPATLSARVAFGDISRPDFTLPQISDERRYAMRLVKQRLHQVAFREAVISAYESRCAISGLPEPLLLDAAHIVADKDELLGQPVVPNGLPLSKIHHAAFDANLIGISPDYRLHVSDRLLDKNDGPILEALKGMHGGRINLPKREQDYPDRDRLQRRFELFKSTS